MYSYDIYAFLPLDCTGLMRDDEQLSATELATYDITSHFQRFFFQSKMVTTRLVWKGK